jgi:hypothetical protein
MMTNTIGILSPYGNFFATEPGPGAMHIVPRFCRSRKLTEA